MLMKFTNKKLTANDIQGLQFEKKDLANSIKANQATLNKLRNNTSLGYIRQYKITQVKRHLVVDGELLADAEAELSNGHIRVSGRDLPESVVAVNNSALKYRACDSHGN